LGLLAVLFLFTDAVVDFFNIQAANQEDARFVVISIGFVSAFTMIFGVYKATLTGLQRIDITNFCRVSFTTVEFFVGWLLLHFGFGIRGLVFAYCTNVLANTGLMWWFLQRMLPDVRVRAWHARRDCLGPIFSLGGRMQLLGIVAVVVTTVDKLALTIGQGLAFLGAYVIAKGIVEKTQSVPHQAFGALQPASAHLHGVGDYDKLQQVYGAAMRLCGLVAVYIFAFLAFNSDLVVLGYVGLRDSNALSAMALQFLCVSTVIHTLTGPGTSMLRGAGKPLLEMVYQGLMVVMFLIFVNLATRYGDERSIVLSFPVALSIASVVFIALANRYFHAPQLCPLNAMFLPFLAAPFAAFWVRFGWNLLPLAGEMTRWSAAGAVVALGAAYTAVFAALAWFLPGLTPKDKEQLVKFVPFGSHLLQRFKRPQPADVGF
ncbi:MAG: hypothetical protein HY706_05205, partial [Candidatus Hydrogenedentes bacterium]|nr:hypothetical protein [Candidatus Hydrogenedentota bacterium]